VAPAPLIGTESMLPMSLVGVEAMSSLILPPALLIGTEVMLLMSPAGVEAMVSLMLAPADALPDCAG